MSREQVAAEIEAFLNDTGGPWDWDDFISISLKDPELELIRCRCAGRPEEFPATAPGHDCGPEGVAVLSSIVRNLRDSPAT
jgi:hypothetical protein